MQLSRRALLVAGAAGGASAAVGYGSWKIRHPEVERPSLTADAWIAARRAPYFIGHRGAGGVVPEHTIEGYQFAIDQRLPAVEMSVGLSADGVPFCLHDPTLDRTTTLAGPLNRQTAVALDRGRVRIPRLGPAWTGDRMPRIPRLEDALEVCAGRVVLCIEAKSGAALVPMLRLLQDRALMGTVILKCPVGSPTVDLAHRAGLPVFAYLGAGEQVDLPHLAQAARQLDRERDVLVIPTRNKGSFIDDALVERAVDQGTPVWVYSTHRRSEVQHYRERGVSGFVVTTAGYASSDSALTTEEGWHSERINPGLLTKDPYSDAYRFRWLGAGAIAVITPEQSAHITVGALGPIRASSYSFEVSAALDEASIGSGGGISVVVCTDDDASPQTPEGRTSGYECTVDGKGVLAIRSNVARSPKEPGQVLASRPTGAAVTPATWTKLTVSVKPGSLRLSWGGASIAVDETRWRGGYAHLGRFGEAGAASYRDLGVQVL